MALLWITPKWPLPPQDGARRASLQLLKSLTRLGLEIDLLVIASEDEAINPEEGKKTLGVRNVHILRRQDSTQNAVLRRIQILMHWILSPTLAATLLPFSNPKLRAQMSSILGKKLWECWVYDGLHPAAHAAKGARFERPDYANRIIYRAHNVESDLWVRKAERTRVPLLKSFFKYQAQLMRSFERSLVEAADGLAPVSAEDLAVFSRWTRLKESRVVPIGFELQAPLAPPRILSLLFIGRLDWPPNQEGLIWFLQKVWPKVTDTRPDLSLEIAGSGDPSGLKTYLAVPGIKFLGRIDHVNEAYAKAALSIVPVFYGSGTRVKAIEAGQFGRACLSTALGVEGTGLKAGESYVRAETEKEWIESLTTLTAVQAEKLGTRAYQVIRGGFDAENAAITFQSLLESKGRGK